MNTDKSKTGRNSPCPCNSGLKFKHCHGDAMKAAKCKDAARLMMLKLILDAQYDKELIDLDKYDSVMVKIENDLNEMFGLYMFEEDDKDEDSVLLTP